MERQQYRHYFHISKESEKSIKEKKREIEKHMIQYHKALIEIQYYDALTISNQTEKKDKEKLVQYVNYIEKILSVLSNDSKEYIENEYILNLNNASWWTKKYNRSTYFKVRKNAINEFLLYVN